MKKMVFAGFYKLTGTLITPCTMREYKIPRGGCFPNLVSTIEILPENIVKSYEYLPFGD